MQGLRPNIEETTLRYGLARGPFLRVCQDAAEDPDHFHVLIIDEVNRGDPARIFGELLYGLEYRGHRIELPLGGQLEVPPNLVVIGTMNSVDRSVALVDYALRRRFAFVRLSPSPEVIRRLRSGEPAALVAAVALDKFNTWLRGRLSPEHELGHSFFLNLGLPLDGPGALASIWQLDLRPLLEEYFFGDREGLESAEAEWRRALLEAEDETQEDGDEAPLASP